MGQARLCLRRRAHCDQVKTKSAPQLVQSRALLLFYPKSKARCVIPYACWYNCPGCGFEMILTHHTDYLCGKGKA